MSNRFIYYLECEKKELIWFVSAIGPCKSRLRHKPTFVFIVISFKLGVMRKWEQVAGLLENLNSFHTFQRSNVLVFVLLILVRSLKFFSRNMNSHIRKQIGKLLLL